MRRTTTCGKRERRAAPHGAILWLARFGANAETASDPRQRDALLTEIFAAAILVRGLAHFVRLDEGRLETAFEKYDASAFSASAYVSNCPQARRDASENSDGIGPEVLA